MAFIPDPPVIGTDFFSPRNSPPGSAIFEGTRHFYGIRRYDVFQHVKGDNGGFNEWHQYNGIDFDKGEGCFDQYEEYRFPHPHTLYISGDNEAGDRNYRSFDPRSVLDEAIDNDSADNRASYAIENKERDCTAGQYGTLDRDAISGHNIGERCTPRQDSNLPGPTAAGHTDIPLGDPTPNDVGNDVSNSSWALHVGSQDIIFYENIVFVRSPNYRQVFFQGKIFYPIHALADSDHRDFEFQFLSYNYWVMYTPIGAGVYMLFVYQTIRNTAGKIVALKQVLTSHNIFPQDTELDSRYFFVSENYLILPFKADIWHDLPDPNEAPPYLGEKSSCYKVMIYYRPCVSDEFYPLFSDPYEMFNVGGFGAEIRFAHWQNTIMFYCPAITITIPARPGFVVQSLTYPVQLYAWVDGEEVDTETTSGITSFISDTKTFSFKKSDDTLDVFEFNIVGSAQGGATPTSPPHISFSRLVHTFTSNSFEIQHEYVDPSITLQLSNYSPDINDNESSQTPQTPWQTITHHNVDFPCTEQRYLEAENYEIRLFTHVDDINSPIVDSLYFRIPLKETRYTETGAVNDTTNNPAIITTSNSQVINTYIEYAGGVFKPTGTTNLYAITSSLPHQFLLLRTDVQSLFYCPMSNQQPDPCSPGGLYATLSDGSTVCILRAPNDKWLYFHLPTNITLPGSTDLEKFGNLWPINSESGFHILPSILSQSGDTYIIGACLPYTTNDGIPPGVGPMALVVTLGSLESRYIDTQSLTADDPYNPTITGIPGKCCNFKNADNSAAVYRGPCQDLWDIMLNSNGLAWCQTNLLDMTECDCNDRGCIDPGPVQEV